MLERKIDRAIEKEAMKTGKMGTEPVTVEIEFQGKNYRLGRFNDIEDAAAARKEAEKALFGNFLDWFREAYPERWKKLNKSKTRSEK